MLAPSTLLLTRRDVAALLDLDTCIAAVERAFRLLGEGQVAQPVVAAVHVPHGGFHIKAGILEAGRSYFVAKTNANFTENRQLHGLPTIQGIVVLCDGENGYPLAVMDSIEITIQRTAAATAVAAKYLSRSDSESATILGCGTQGRVQLRALTQVRPVKRAFAYDLDYRTAQRFAAELSRELGIDVTAVQQPRFATRKSDICVTCTPSRSAILGPADLRPGTFIAGVGADSPEKCELAPALLAAATLVVDVLDQCATIGDLHHALAAGLVTTANVYAELGTVVAGRTPGRRSPDEIVVFDSTGMALQDAAAAAAVYQRAVREGCGSRIDFAA